MKNMDDVPTIPMYQEEEEYDPERTLECDKAILKYIVSKIYNNNSGVKKLQLEMERLRNELQVMKEEQKNIVKNVLKMNNNNINHKSDTIVDVDAVATTTTTTTSTATINKTSSPSVTTIVTPSITNKQKSLIDVNPISSSSNSNNNNNFNFYYPRTIASLSPPPSKSYSKEISDENNSVINYNEKSRKRTLSPKERELPLKKRRIISIDFSEGFKPNPVANIRNRTIIKVDEKVREKGGGGGNKNKDKDKDQDDDPPKDTDGDGCKKKSSKKDKTRLSRRTFDLIMKHPSLNDVKKLDASVPKLIKRLETRGGGIRLPKHKRFTKYRKFKDAVLLCFNSSEKRYQFEKIIKELPIPRSEKPEVFIEKICDEESDNSDLGRYLKNAKVFGAVGNFHKEANSNNFIFSFKGDHPFDTHKITSVDEYLKLLDFRESKLRKEARFQKMYEMSNSSRNKQTTSINGNNDKNAFYGKSHWR
uniref:Uncharacterized protein n=1 Tax=Armadillidium vulgare clopovirus TaxID=2984284 RepID=A0A9C7CEL2_9VIRU|nr:MAG: hypothetical protein [Armadillidium vulgare clopovirus]